VQLRHEEDNHLLFGVDGEVGIEKPSPVVLSRRSQFRRVAL
jgi:hypothetical protein